MAAMNQFFQVRYTLNGATQDMTVSVKTGLEVINNAMLGTSTQKVRSMSAGSGRYDITYVDGSRVVLVLVDEQPEDEQPEDEQPAPKRRALIARRRASGDLMGDVVTVKGKDYVVSEIVPATRPGGLASVSYWSARDGERFGATRTASAAAKRGTVAHGVWHAALDAANGSRA